MKQILRNYVVMVFGRKQRFAIHPLLLPKIRKFGDFT